MLLTSTPLAIVRETKGREREREKKGGDKKMMDNGDNGVVLTISDD